MHLGATRPAKWRHVDHKGGTNLIGYLAKTREVKGAGL